MATPEMIEAERDYLLRYALAQLRDRAVAEEVVQETLLAALESLAGFKGASSLRTWLTAILRYKLLDALRAKKRDERFEPLPDEVDDADFDGLFAPGGHWREPVRAWGQPEQALIAREFWAVFERCSQAMPRRTAMVFVMRELMGLEIADICKQMEISATNCSVMLYRARMSLRECFSIRWTGGEAS